MGKSINKTGLAEIKQFLSVNHKNWSLFRANPSCLHAWALDAEIRTEEGFPPMIKIEAHNSVSGKEVEFTISDAGADEVEYWEE